MLNKKKLTPEQLEQLSNRTGNRIQTIKFEVELSFNDLYSGSEAELPVERVVEGIKEHLGVLWHVPASGSDIRIPPEGHEKTCATRGSDLISSFKMCDCGAYGEQGPPRYFWTLLSEFTKVKARKSVVQEIDECAVNHKYFKGEKCPACDKEIV